MATMPHVMQCVAAMLQHRFVNLLRLVISKFSLDIYCDDNIFHLLLCIMHFRKESSFNLGTAEQKLLYTLHWILSDAADECSLQAEEEGKLDISTFAYLFPLSAITVNLNSLTRNNDI